MAGFAALWMVQPFGWMQTQMEQALAKTDAEEKK